MRVQIIIDDGAGGGDAVTVDTADKSKENLGAYGENGDTPYWRGPFYLVGPEEAVKAGVRGAAQVFEASHSKR